MLVPIAGEPPSITRIKLALPIGLTLKPVRLIALHLVSGDRGIALNVGQAGAASRAPSPLTYPPITTNFIHDHLYKGAHGVAGLGGTAGAPARRSNG
jgi:hypothetical protein